MILKKKIGEQVGGGVAREGGVGRKERVVRQAARQAASKAKGDPARGRREEGKDENTKK